MNKLLPWLAIILAALALSCTIGSVAAGPGPHVPQPFGKEYIASRSVCDAPPSLMNSLLDRFPSIRHAPEALLSMEKRIGARLPGIMAMLPGINGMQIEEIIVKAAPRLL